MIYIIHCFSSRCPPRLGSWGRWQNGEHYLLYDIYIYIYIYIFIYITLLHTGIERVRLPRTELFCRRRSLLDCTSRLPRSVSLLDHPLAAAAGQVLARACQIALAGPAVSGRAPTVGRKSAGLCVGRGAEAGGRARLHTAAAAARGA